MTANPRSANPRPSNLRPADPRLSAAETTPSPLRAAVWMLGAIGSFTLMGVAGRELSADYSTFEIMFWRSLVGLPILGVALWFSAAGAAQLTTRRPGLHLGRNLAHFFGQNCWFYAIGLIPLAQVFAIEFTNPILVALLAPLLLGERFTQWRLIAAVLGFAGILIVTRPFAPAPQEGLAIGQAAAAAAALGFALTTIATKRLSETDTTICILFYMIVSQAAMALLCIAVVTGGLPTLPWGASAGWLVVVGLCGLSAHFCITTAFRYADAAIVAPMDFFRLPLVAVVAAALYGEPLEFFVFLGGALVFLGNFLNLRAERRRMAADQGARPS